MFAINFYSEIYEGMLRNGRKTGTIRLGDKSAKYHRGEIIWITVGQRFSRKRKLFPAVVDAVIVKPLGELTPHEIELENPEFRTQEDLIGLLATIYDRFITPDETVTLVRFSAIEEN